MRGNYLSGEDAEQILKRFRLTNVSASDPSDTVALLSIDEDPLICFNLEEAGEVVRRGLQDVRLPDREPQILPQE